MLKYVVLVLGILGGSCAGVPASAPQPLPSTHEDFGYLLPASSESGVLIFIGAAGVRLNQQEAIDLALKDAARRVAFFHQVGGTVVHQVEIGSGFLDYHSEQRTTLEYDEEGYIAYREALEFDPHRDVRIEHQTVFVRTRYRTSQRLSLAHQYARTDQRPQWVDNPPKELSGFRAGVGFAGPRLYHKDTVIASYENAVFAIITAISHTVRSEIASVQGSGGVLAPYSQINRNEVRAAGTLRGFYILETWTDPATKAVWTLAIAEAP
ncbi:MAG: hypothetical protein LBD74_07465 [Spirochaetaceae bacterium]|jgi:hypothetical protein|nr:hypothetical protein [Spirochaetaceae bacterium]